MVSKSRIRDAWSQGLKTLGYAICYKKFRTILYVLKGLHFSIPNLNMKTVVWRLWVGLLVSPLEVQMYWCLWYDKIPECQSWYHFLLTFQLPWNKYSSLVWWQIPKMKLLSMTNVQILRKLRYTTAVIVNQFFIVKSF